MVGARGEPLASMSDASVTLSAGAPPALAGVTLSVWPGDRMVLLGANGSGKSTLLNVLAGVLEPQSGRADRACDVGLVRQSPAGAWASHTVADEVRFALACRGMTGDAAESRLAETVSRLGLLDLERRDPRMLSAGEQQRVHLAAALAPGPPLVLLDEPTTHADVDATGLLTRFLSGDPTAGPPPDAIVVATHRIDLVLLATRVVVLDSGRIVDEHTAGEVLRTRRWRRWDLGEPSLLTVMDQLGELPGPHAPHEGDAAHAGPDAAAVRRCPRSWAELEARWPAR